MVKKKKLNFREDNFRDFLDKIGELVKLSDIIKIKIDSEDILIYSMLGSESITLAFKSFQLKTDNYLNGLEDLDTTINIIIPYAKKFAKNVEFISDSDSINFDLNYVEDEESGEYQSRSFSIKSGKLKINVQCGEWSEIKDLTKGLLNSKLVPKNRKWGFSINLEDFQTIKKLSRINSSSEEDRKLIEISNDGGVIKISEVPIWEMEVGSVEEVGDVSLLFNKQFLPLIREDVIIDFNIFETFILLKGDQYSLMISFETDFSDY